MLKMSIRDNSNPTFPLIDDKFIYFRQDEPLSNDHIDLDVTFVNSYNEILREVGEFDGKVHISENIFCRKYIKKDLTFTIIIKSGDSKRVQLIFYEKKKNMWELINKNMISYNIILRIIEFMLLKKGILLVHAAAVEKEGSSHVLVGRGGSLKTSICLNLIRKYGFNYIGDDRIILKDGYAYPFPMNYSLFNYMINNRSDEFITAIDKVQYLLSHGKYLEYSKIAQPRSKIENVFLIYRHKEAPVNPPELGDVASRLVVNNFMENFIDLSALRFDHSPILDYLIYHSYFNEDIIDQQEDSQSRLFDELTKKANTKPILVDEITEELMDKIHGMIQYGS